MTAFHLTVVRVRWLEAGQGRLNVSLASITTMAAMAYLIDHVDETVPYGNSRRVRFGLLPSQTLDFMRVLDAKRVGIKLISPLN